MSIAAVVVTYNRKDILVQCVQALLAQTHPDLDILIIDNASDDGTREAVAPFVEGSRCQYVNTGENLGGAGGFQYGMRLAMEQGYDHVWLMDDDTLPEPDALRRLAAAGEALGGLYGWISSAALWVDGQPCLMNVQRRTPYQDIPEAELMRTDGGAIGAQMASFVSLFVPASSVRRFGLPIKEFFIWGDDWEYTRRISREMKCYVAPDSRVVHAMKHNTVVNIAVDTIERMPRYRYAYRNDIVLYRREGIRGWAWVLTKYVWHSAQVLLKSPDRRWIRLQTIWKGFAEGIGFHPEIERIK